MPFASNSDAIFMIQIFISFFFKKPRSRKSVKIAQGNAPANYGRPGESLDVSDLDQDDEVVLEDGDSIDLDEDEAVLEEAAIEDDEDEVDEGQGAHNEKVARTLKDKAIRLMAQRGIEIGSDEEKTAQLIFPRVCILYIFSQFSAHYYC